MGDQISTLRSQVSGPVYVPGDAGYDDARRVWNASIDRRPAVIAQCLTAQDVAHAVTYAVGAGLEIAVRGGAHSVSGQSVVDGGMMIDLSMLNAVSVDPQARRARCGGGALLGEVSAAAQEHGLAYPVGTVSHTGVGGLTLGGGMGWLSRKHGLSIDNMTSAEVVTADGQILRADESTNSDLFWAIRGGGGNFGVVTEFEFALHPVGPMIHFAIMFWPLDDGAKLLRRARDVVGSLPDETNVIVGALNAPPMPFVPEEHHFAPGYAAIVVGFGTEAEHQGVVADLREAGAPLFEFATPMPYMALSTMLDEANAWGFHYYDKACYVEDLTDGVIDVLTEHVPRKSSPMSIALFFRLDNGYSAVGEDATAFSGGRSPRYNLFTIAAAPDPQLLDADRTWVRELVAALAPHTIDGAYVNGLDEEGNVDRVRASYGPQKYERLAAIKAKYDPDNVFHRNANIKPGVTVPPQQVDVTEAALTEKGSSRAR
jgi:FAD/FMN-containing dehydrogenase